MTLDMEKDLTLVLDWYESEPSIWVAIITGSGRAFCAGQDLKVRRMTKALVAALNRLALGGGAEIVMNCDVVIGHQGGILGFPEVRRGLIAPFVGIPQLLRRVPVLVPYLDGALRESYKEGVQAFLEKRAPLWRNPSAKIPSTKL